MNPQFPISPFAFGIHFDQSIEDGPEFDEEKVATWLQDVAASRGRAIQSLSYVFVSDEELYDMNVEHLEHDTYTDIITFDLSDESFSGIQGECYISWERVQENAAGFGESPERELLRVIVHGLLHLCGLDDHTEEDQQNIRAAEEAALTLWSGA